jgi:hypothetical protein
VNQLYWLAMTLRYHLWSEPDFRGRICAIRANLTKQGLQPDWGNPVSLFFETGPAARPAAAFPADQPGRLSQQPGRPVR